MSHDFLVEDLGAFLTNLEARKYTSSQHGNIVAYSKIFSDTLIKRYAYKRSEEQNTPVAIHVNYELVHDGSNLLKLVKQLKTLNLRYRQTLPGWKTRTEPRKGVREHRWQELQKFLARYRELIGCFRYEADDRLTEGNYSFNLQVASTPRQQKICIEFIKALSEAHTPYGIQRGRREADKPVQQRNGWIKRYAHLHRRRGWTPLEIARDIQRELRNGTWNQRSRLQYNIANSTICKIAGLKIPSSASRDILMN